MQQFISLWSALSLQRRVVVVLATAAMFATILAMSRLATAPTMTLLYAGLENGAAGDVVQALEAQGAIYEVRGGAIFVDARQRDQLRMTLASEGLPANNSQGYELLDSLSGFGTTSQMFDAAYWRAKEGELARTIVSSAQIAMARVHIANSGSNPFQRNVTPTASVTVTPRGGQITAAQAKAFRFLVASAVAGLDADDVAVIDGNGGLIGNSDDVAPSSGTDDRAQVLKERVQRLLEARVGPGKAVVEVSVETVTESESIRERRFDPDSRVAISTDTEERSNTSNEAGNGDVTVASNLPDGDAAGGDSSSAQNSETRERINYEVSETEREIVRAAGSIKRLSVAVLVDGNSVIDANGAEVFEARSEEEIASLKELVSSAVGFEEARGDVITIKSMELQSIAPIGTVVSSSLLDQLNLDLMSAIQMAVLALVTLILGLFVVRPVLSKPVALPPPAPTETGALAGQSDFGLPALNGEIENDSFELPDLGISPNFAGGGDDLPDLAMLGGASQDPVERLRAMIGERQEETVEILRSWLDEKEEEA